MSCKATVFIVDDDLAVRESLGFLLQSVGQPVESYATANEFLDAYDPARAGCLILDIRMPGLGGLDLQERLFEGGISIPVIIITGHASVALAVRAVRQGALDFLEKPFNDQVLLDRINQAFELDAASRKKREECEMILLRLGLLTRREREVMDLITTGKLTKVIVSELGISRKTFEIHRARIMNKMQVMNEVDLAHKAWIIRECGNIYLGPHRIKKPEHPELAHSGGPNTPSAYTHV